nr:hypothetical protein [uncultured Mucilaginibacter sp.]
MKAIQFNFNHPVRGNATLTPVNSVADCGIRVRVESTKDNLVEIPLADCSEGKWKLTLDWEYDGKIFSHQEDFEVRASKNS